MPPHPELSRRQPDVPAGEQEDGHSPPTSPGYSSRVVDLDNQARLASAAPVPDPVAPVLYGSEAVWSSVEGDERPSKGGQREGVSMCSGNTGCSMYTEWLPPHATQAGSPVSRNCTSFKVTSTSELLHNDISKALNCRVETDSTRVSLSSASDRVLASDGGESYTDCWSKASRERISGVRKLIRDLFWALESELMADQQLSGPHAHLAQFRAGTPRLFLRLVRHETFGLVYLILTTYALFGPDLLESIGHTAMNTEDRTLAVLNTFVLFLFLVEQVLFLSVYNRYLLTLRCWVDMLAMISIIGDSIIGAEFLTSDAFVAMRGSRLTKILRVGGRSSRFVRLVQLIRFVPRLNEFLQRGTNELAFSLWLKRMKLVFGCLDKEGKGELSSTEMVFLNAALEAEFPRRQPDHWLNWFVDGKTKTLSSGGSSSALVAPVVPSSTGTSWAQFLKGFIGTPLGKRSYVRCKEDIDCMKESCALVEQASGRLTLKVCILVLLLLVTMQLLLKATPDLSKEEGLRNADGLMRTPGVTSGELCDFVLGEYAGLFDGALLSLVVDSKEYWREGCHCCDPDALGSGQFLDEDAMHKLDRHVRRATDREVHEVITLLIMGENGNARSMAVYDWHKQARTIAVYSLMQTCLVVVLLTSLVLYFATDMRKLSNNNVLHPLWSLMDDMCSLRSMEVLSVVPCSDRTLHDSDELANTLYRKHLSASLPKMLRCRSRIPVADELLQLRASFEKLRLAMQSWSKYVPIVLLKQLFEANVEAAIGCSFVEVSVVFIAIHDFKGLCEALNSQEVLEMMADVLQVIHDALHHNGGTMLEFIGDEVLAIFNAPAKVADYQANAIIAALEAQDAVARLGRPGVRLECSVHKARVLAGNLGSPTRMKYGVLGDGVNLSARLKSLNTRYDTNLLVSGDAMDFDGAEDLFLARPVGDLVLKGRTTPTPTLEVLAKTSRASQEQVYAVERHREAFALYKRQQFAEAKHMFEEVQDLMGQEQSQPETAPDRVSGHLAQLCEQLIISPPDSGWDGSELLTKKAF